MTEAKKPKDPELALLLAKNGYFDTVLLDGERLTCRLISWFRYSLHVETEEGRILLPKHSVKYFVLEETQE